MSGSAAAASAGTEPVRKESRFDERRLERWLRENVADFAGPLTVEQFRGGNQTPRLSSSRLSAPMSCGASPPARRWRALTRSMGRRG